MKAKILLLLTIVTFLSSCESNDNPTINITAADLVGSWNLTKQTIEDGSLSITASGQTLTANYSAYAKDIDFKYVFSENPNKLNLQGKYTFVATASFLGQTQDEEQEIDTNLLPITETDWSLNGTSITISDDNGLPTVLNVIEFSTNNLVLQGEINETETDNGETVTIKALITMELEK